MIHTSESLLAQDGNDENYHYELMDGEKYRLSKDELDWLSFVRGRYAIAEHFDNNIVDGVYTMDTIGLSESLWMDDCRHYPACLSEDSVLAMIVWYSADTDRIARISKHINTDLGQ
jgi:hypothetical protein